MNTEAVTAEVVRGWADDSLREWLHGYYFHDETQYRITCVDAEDRADLYEVTTADHRRADPRRFHVAVQVTDAEAGQ